MTITSRWFMGGLAAAAIVSWLPIAAAGQTAAANTRARSLKTPWGDPDLQGTWTNTTTTPLERPRGAGDKAILSEEERTAEAKRVQALGDHDKDTIPGDSIVSYNEFWFEKGTLNYRTSLITDPPDGRLPPLTPAAQERWAAQNQQRRGPASSWLDLNTWNRCISRGLPGAMLPGFYNHNYEIVQAPGYVAILIEMIHETRIIPLNGQPHLNETVGQWLGDARGHFEGNTLVVETTNFNDKLFERGGVNGFGAGTKLVERYTRIAVDQLDYEFTVEAPNVFTRPWTVSTPMVKQSGDVLEYACHEGNHALVGILSGARADERKAAAKAAK